MFQQIDLRHFKCFELLRLPLRQLTLLSGFNASGKSSVLQAFALLHQTVRENQRAPGLLLNGNTVRLGTAGDVIDQVTKGRRCGIGLLTEHTECQWEFEAERSDTTLAIDSVTINGRRFVDRRILDDSLLLQQMLPVKEEQNPASMQSAVERKAIVTRLQDLFYLTAERAEPRDTFELDALGLGQVIGAKGENAVSLLHSRGEEHVVDELALPNAPKSRVHQVGARMATLFPGCEIEVAPISRTNSLTLGVRTSNQTDFHRPAQTGFGITQVLPIIVASLFASPMNLLLIEKPEVHLHPSAQAMMGEFLAEVAAAGIQVVLETHSDHILNGVRRAVKRGVLHPENVVLHFFRSRGGEGPQVQSPYLGGDGTIDHWPEGFFDQFDKDMNYFAGWN